MSDEKKPEVLSDDELEKVSGGTGEDAVSYLIKTLNYTRQEAEEIVALYEGKNFKQARAALGDNYESFRTLFKCKPVRGSWTSL